MSTLPGRAEDSRRTPTPSQSGHTSARTGPSRTDAEQAHGRVATLASRIALARSRAGLSQAALAELVGGAQPVISAWESGARTPTVESLTLLARTLGVTTDWLLGLTE